jgi:hypothetical protein
MPDYSPNFSSQAIIAKLWPFMSSPIVISLIANLSRQGYNSPKRIKRENIDWILSKFTDLLLCRAPIGVASALAGGVLDMSVGREDYMSRVYPVLGWYFGLGKEMDEVEWRVRSECEEVGKSVGEGWLEVDVALV